MPIAESESKIPVPLQKSPAVADRKAKRQTLEERLKLRQAQIAARLAKIATSRKADNAAAELRLNRLIGAACRADDGLHPRIRALLLKNVQSPKDREFLLTEGWLGEKTEARR